MIRFCGIVATAQTPDEQAWTRAALACPPGTAPSVAALPGVAMSAAPLRSGQAASASLHCHDGLLVLANARIDGLTELLEALGAHAPTRPCDPSQLIAAAWRRWGTDCLSQLYGDYAFVVHDTARRETFCARDHIGARPFFYSLDPQRLAFASELATLHSLPGIDLTLDEPVVATTLLNRLFEPGNETFQRAIRRLPAGHSLHCLDGKSELRRWWRPELASTCQDVSDDQATGKTLQLLEQAVADRLVGASKAAVHLSGGIDSSLIAAFAVRTLKQRGLPAPTGYSWQQAKPEAARDSEPGWAEVIREELGLELRSPRLTPRELADLLLVDWTASHDVRNLLHEAAIQRDAGNDRVEVILSGWGGDEGLSFHGRGLDPELLVTGRWLTLFREGQPPGLYGGVRAFYGAARRLWIDLKPRKSLRRLIDRGKSLIAPDFARQTQLLPVHRFREFGVRATQIALLRDGATANRIENWAISGARHGIVYGYPLLDRRLLEYLFSLPPRMFKRRGQDRWLAREVAKGLVPDLIRCNSRKDEPERVEQMSGDLAEAYRLIAPLLDDPNTPLARARYVDMPRLREQLSEAIETGSTQSRGLRAALQFLDLK